MAPSPRPTPDDPVVKRQTPADPAPASSTRAGPSRRRTVAIAILVVALILVVSVRRWHATLEGEMAPGAAAAVRRALGQVGVDRIVQVISPGNRASFVSARTHLASGVDHGRLYGSAFDLCILDTGTADSDVHALRMQGIAAWRRGPGAPGGAEGLAPHIHCVWPGAPSSNVQNGEQISSFVHGYRGLVGIGVPRSRWPDPSIQADEQARVAAVYEHVNGLGSLATVLVYEARHRPRR